MVDPAEAAEIDLILLYCGFTAPGERASIAADGFEVYEDIKILTAKDIGSLAKGFAERTVAAGRIQFGLRRTNLLKATIHWVQDFGRISREPSLDDLQDANEFKAAIEIARQRAEIRKRNSEESDSLSKAADPGKLKRQKDWTTWSRALKNYLSTILGQDGVPLSYIIREEDDPDYGLEAEPDFDFEQLSINCAPLTGLIFKTDARKVHQLIHGFIQGEIAETWIKPKEKRQDGRIDYQALAAHYGGEGNKSVRIAEAEVLRTTLHYKSERTMTFEKFLTNMQSMFTGFADNGEVLSDAQKIRLLFGKVQSPNLIQVKNALQVSYDLNHEEVSYDFIANSLAAEAAKSPDTSNRNAGAVNTRGGDSGAPEKGIKGPDGAIFTGYYKNFGRLSDSDKQAIYDERKRLNLPTTKMPAKKHRTSSIATKKKTLAKMHREIASMKSRFKAMEGKREAEENSDDADEDATQDNAGDQFGGRKKKQKKKGDKG
jgi:hypothetical protein